jgi:hypothetical protein
LDRENILVFRGAVVHMKRRRLTSVFAFVSVFTFALAGYAEDTPQEYMAKADAEAEYNRQLAEQERARADAAEAELKDMREYANLADAEAEYNRAVAEHAGNSAANQDRLLNGFAIHVTPIGVPLYWGDRGSYKPIWEAAAFPFVLKVAPNFDVLLGTTHRGAPGQITPHKNFFWAPEATVAINVLPKPWLGVVIDAGIGGRLLVSPDQTTFVGGWSAAVKAPFRANFGFTSLMAGPQLRVGGDFLTGVREVTASLMAGIQTRSF